jgi:GLPGLI family protein
MKNFFAALIFIFLCGKVAIGQEGKLLSDCTVFFDVAAAGSKIDPEVVKTMEGTTKVLYIKGSKSRSDLITHTFKQTTITDAKTDSTVILRELGNTKYISYLDANKMRAQNKKYEGIQFNTTSEKKTILGYECKKVVAKLANGSAYNVFYTSSIIPSNRQYEYQFKDLQGFVLEYEEESEDGKTNIKYSASKISLLPVPAAKFDVPKTGYRVL